MSTHYLKILNRVNTSEKKGALEQGSPGSPAQGHIHVESHSLAAVMSGPGLPSTPGLPLQRPRAGQHLSAGSQQTTATSTSFPSTPAPHAAFPVAPSPLGHTSAATLQPVLPGSVHTGPRHHLQRWTPAPSHTQAAQNPFPHPPLAKEPMKRPCASWERGHLPHAPESQLSLRLGPPQTRRPPGLGPPSIKALRSGPRWLRLGLTLLGFPFLCLFVVINQARQNSPSGLGVSSSDLEGRRGHSLTGIHHLT